jgi:hypothetical protein
MTEEELVSDFFTGKDLRSCYEIDFLGAMQIVGPMVL